MSFPFSPRRMAAVARKELRHVFRDPRMRAVIFLMPVFQLVILGIAANFDVQHVPVVVVDADHSAVSREIASRIGAGTALDLASVTELPAEGERALENGTAEVVVVVPRGTASDLRRGQPTVLPVWVDGTDTNRAMQAQAYVETIVARVGRERRAAPLLPAGAVLQRPGLPQPRVRVLFNPTLASRWFMVPGVVAMVITVITVLLSAMAIVKERERGTMEQLVVTPIRPAELILGKLLPFVGIGLVVGTIVALVAVFGFRVPFRGSAWQLLGMSLLYLLSTLSIGLLVSTVSATQQQAMMSAILVLMPSFLLGGVFYPVDNMPAWARAIAAAIPLRYFIGMLRGVFLKGLGFTALWRESLALAALGIVLVIVSVARFRKRSA